MARLALAIVVIGVVLVGRAASVAVTTITPRHGSTRGGTIITVVGRGFADSTFNFGAGNENKGNTVTLVSESGSEEYDCAVEKDSTTEGLIACETSPMNEGTYYVRVEVDGVAVPDSSYCGGNPKSWGCSFSVVNWRTPKITDLYPSIGTPGQHLNVYGRIYTDKVRAADAAASNGVTASLRRVYVGGMPCQLFKATDELYGVHLYLNSEGEASNWGNFTCLMTGNNVESQNVSFILDENFGRSLSDPGIVKVSADYKLYSVQTHATVSSVSPATGSTQGGTVLTIAGNYLNDRSIEILVGGSPCTNIIDRTDESVKCTTPSDAGIYNGWFPGSRGISVEIYSGLDDPDVIADQPYEDIEGYSKERLTVEGFDVVAVASSAPALVRGLGFFKPAKAGTYSLTSNKPDTTKIYLSSDNTAGNKVLMTGGVQLEEGTLYYLEVIHNAATTEIAFQVDAYLKETDYVSTQTSQAKREVQTIKTEAPDNKEIQVFELSAWEAGEGVNQVMDLCITCAEQGAVCTSGMFRLQFNGITTWDLAAASEAAAVEIGIGAMATMGLGMVSVEKSENDACVSYYRMTVKKAIGSINLMAFAVTDDIQVTLTNITQSVPDLNYFTVALKDVPASPVTITNPGGLAAAVWSLFGTQCSVYLTSGIGVALHYEDFESPSSLVQGERSGEDSFCGQYSMKGPSVIFPIDEDEQGYRLDSYKSVCVAYKGRITATLKVSIAFTDFDTGALVHDQVDFDIFQSTSEWEHACVDVLSVLGTRGTSIYVTELLISASDTSEFYIDNLFIGTLTVWEGYLEFLRGQRRLPTHRARFSNVVATKQDDTYTVTMDPIDCAHNIPLLEVAYAGAPTMVSGIATYSVTANAQIGVRRHTAASPPVGGKFTLTMPGGGQLPNIDWDVEDSTLEAAIETLTGINDVTVERDGTCRGYTWTVTFNSPGGRQEELSATGSLGHPEANITAEVVARGGLYLKPIPGDWVRCASSTPQVEVFINSVPSVCTDDCSFSWTEEATPTVSAVALDAGVLTVTGTAFSTTQADNTVTVGGVACLLTAASDTSITCDLGESPGGQQPVVVTVAGKGAAAPATVSVPVSVSSISPTSGSIEGGTVVTLAGTALSGQATVSLGGAICDTDGHDSEYTSIKCTTGASVAGLVDAITVNIGGVDATVTASYTYTDATASVTDVSQTILSVAGGEVLTITGSGFGEENGESHVSIGETEAIVSTWSDAEIVVQTPSLGPGQKDLRVYVHPDGFATTAVAQVDYRFTVSAVEPTTGSLMGGQRITITGAGLSEDAEVKVGEADCTDVTLASDALSCTVGSCGKTHTIENTGTSAYGDGYAWEPANIEVRAGDSVTWRWSSWGTISGAEFRVYSVASQDDIDYDGTGFYSGDGSEQGQYTFRFNNPGNYYYGGYANQHAEIFLRGSVVVSDAVAVEGQLSVMLAGHEATYQGGALSFTCDPADTPTVTLISPAEGTSEDTITITGTGLATGSPVVKVGAASCTLEGAASDNEISCRVHNDEELSVGGYNEVSVDVPGKGLAQLQIRNNGRFFRLLPHVTVVTPNSGSLAGGTELTVSGGGLTDALSVLIGGTPCEIQERSYTQLVCTTGASSEGSHDVQVLVRDITSPAACIQTAACQYEYTSLSTPVVSAVEPVAVSAPGQMLTIAGSGFGSIETEVAVTVGGETCAIGTVTDIQITCALPDLVQGAHEVVVTVVGKGKAQTDSAVMVTSQFSVTAVNPGVGSLMGSTEVTIAGNGFSPSSVVTIDGQQCESTTVSPSQIICQTPAHAEGSVGLLVTSDGAASSDFSFQYSSDSTPTVTAISPQTAVSGDDVTLTGTGLSGATVSIGGAPCTVIGTGSDTELTCTLGARQGGPAVVDVIVGGLGRARIDDGVTFDYSFQIDSFQPQAGSLGGGQLVTITGKGFGAESTVQICEADCPISGEVSTDSVTCITPPSATARDCAVQVFNGAQSVSHGTDRYTYDESLTPTVTSVSPKIGGTAGGTALTISGTGLSAATAVLIDGSPCEITSQSETEIECTTGAHSGSIETQVTVEIGTDGDAKADGDVGFLYADLWSSVFSWGGGPLPAEGELVVIPADTTIFLDTETPILAMLLLDGGNLIFLDGTSPHLHAENVLIANGGLLQIGTEDQPLESEAQITMHGHHRSQELPIYGAKTLGVREGRLELHGKPIANTWTLLDQTANAGDDTITLQIPVTWKVGDRIVIATTGDRHSQEENEEREIAAIVLNAEGNSEITLTEPLSFTHLGETRQYQTDCRSNVEVEFRAEVGLLTRNIVFRGSSEETWEELIPKCPDGFDTGMFAKQTCFQGRHGEEIGSDQFGASIMIHSKDPSTDGENHSTQAHIENVELENVGQAFRLGRYPIHWHLMGDMTGNYVRGCAIHKSFNRAVTIHGTHNLLVERNVAHNIMGGAFFIEDGIETGNTIQYNLAIFVRQSTSLLNDDITPAAYWVTNPNNTLQHNHAAGGTHFGLWYRMHEHPDGPSFDPNVCQQNVELGVFKNNTVHSQGWFGLWIFQDYTPMEGSSCSSNTPSPAKYDSLTAWKCEKGAEWVNGGAIQFIDFTLVDNSECGIDIKLIFNTFLDENNGAAIKGGYIIDNPMAIVLPFAPGLFISGVTFIGGDALGVTHISGTCTSKCGGFQYYVRDVCFTDVDARITWRWEHEGVIVDVDGTFTGLQAGTKVATYSELFDTPECTKSDSLLYSSGAVPSTICNPSARFHRFAFNDPYPQSLEFKDAIMTNQYGSAISEHRKKRITHKFGWMFLLLGHEEYTLTWQDGGQFSNVSYDGKFYDFAPGDYIIVNQDLSEMPDRISAGEGGRDLTVGETSPLSASSQNLDWHYDVENRVWSYIVSGGQESTRKKRLSLELLNPDLKAISVSPNIYRCFYEDCIPKLSAGTLPPVRDLPANHTQVSSATESSDCFLFEGDTAEGNTVTIPEECWIKWSIPSITVYKLHILGNLYVDPAVSSITLRATYIIVQGRLIAGWSPSEPHSGELTIELIGDHSTPEIAISAGLNLGSKALGCLGQCELHGLDTPTYAKLAATASAGSKQLTLQSALNCQVGDRVGIAPSGFNAQHAEMHMVESISTDRRTLTLAESLQYDHKHEVLSYGDQWKGMDMSAEVAVFTRTIKIKGAAYEGMSEESYGARVLVATHGEYNALGRFSNVEFYLSGQEGYTEPTDPRFSLAFLGAAENCQVFKCSFADGFSAAIGVFSTARVNITSNVIHHTVENAVVVEGSVHTFDSNLLMTNLFDGSYNGRFEQNNFEFPASVNVEKAFKLTMRNNVIAGAQRVGYKVAGQPCGETNLWEGNVVRASLHGVQKVLTSVGGCAVINGFTVYKAWDYGIYHLTTDSVIVQNCAIIDSTVGYLGLVYGPPALSHEHEDKFAKINSSLVVARSDPNDCTPDVDEATDPNLILRRIAGVNKKASSTPTGGRTIILLPYFSSAPHGVPFKGWPANMNYPALYGRFLVEDLTVANVGEVCNGQRDLVFYTNPDNEDIFHPTFVSGMTKINVDKESLAFYARPNPKKVNPSDCVDMQCDAKLKVLIRDTDGSFLGNIGSILPESAYGWDVQGLGVSDARIPKPALTDLGGQKLDANTLFPNKGVVRNGACTEYPAWNAYECTEQSGVTTGRSSRSVSSYQYQMLIIESLDNDTETRRLSPVALTAEGFVDLNNGPQDHGWCAGYTCQKRISTFYTLVGMGLDYELYFTGVPPKRLRLHLPPASTNTEQDATRTRRNALQHDRITLAIWYPNPQAIEVSLEDGTYVPPNNAYIGADGKERLYSAPANDPDRYTPKADTAEHGDNYMDRAWRKLHVAVQRGGEGHAVVTLEMKDHLFVTFGVTKVSVDDFFEVNLVQNLALFLGIPANKVRTARIVEETGTRRKRSTSVVEVTVEVQADDAETANDMLAKITGPYAMGKDFSSITGGEVVSLKGSATMTGEDVAKYDEKLKNGEDITAEVVYSVPARITLSAMPSGEEGSVLTPTTVFLWDVDDNLVNTNPAWTVTVALDSSDPMADPAAVLSGTTTVTFSEGSATFSNLTISHSGSYRLVFTTSNSALTVTSETIVLSQRTVGAEVTKMSEELSTVSDGAVTFTVQLTDKDGNDLPDVSFKGYTWKLQIDLDDAPSYAPTTLQGSDTAFDFDPATGRVTTSALALVGGTAYYKYNLKFRLFTEPAGYDFTATYVKVQIYPDDETAYLHNSDANLRSLKLVFADTYHDVIGDVARETWETSLYNKLTEENPTLFFSPMFACQVDGKFTVITAVRSKEATAVIEFLDGFTGITVRGRSLVLEAECPIVVDGSCYSPTTTASLSTAAETTTVEKPVEEVGLDSTTTIIIFSVLGASVVLAGLIIGISCYVKRSAEMRKVSAMRCMNNSQSSNSSDRPLTNSLDSFQPSPVNWERRTPDSAYGMTPVA